MWQITWILSLLPNWFWTLILILGVLGILSAWVLKFIPFINTYRLPIQVGSVLALLIGVYFQGVIANEAKWQAELTRLEEAVKIGEEEARKLNEQLSAEISSKKSIQEVKTKEIIRYIDKWQTKEILKEVPVEGPERIRIEEVIKYIENCPVPKEFIDVHNDAAMGVKK
jgi:hypothetical protein